MPLLRTRAGDSDGGYAVVDYREVRDDLGTMIDLEGGSDAAMQQSLRTKVLPLPDSSLILPGHGPASTMARERVSNPYLQALQGSGA